jgi:hypothetical protein
MNAYFNLFLTSALDRPSRSGLLTPKEEKNSRFLDPTEQKLGELQRRSESFGKAKSLSLPGYKIRIVQPVFLITIMTMLSRNDDDDDIVVVVVVNNNNNNNNNHHHLPPIGLLGMHLIITDRSLFQVAVPYGKYPEANKNYDSCRVTKLVKIFLFIIIVFPFTSRDTSVTNVTGYCLANFLSSGYRPQSGRKVN